MEESKAVSMAILAIIGIVAVFGLVLLLSAQKTGQDINNFLDICKAKSAKGEYSEACARYEKQQGLNQRTVYRSD